MKAFAGLLLQIQHFHPLLFLHMGTETRPFPFLRPSFPHRKPPRISPSQILLTAHVLSTHLSFTFPSQPSQCCFPQLPGFLSFHPDFRNRPFCAQLFACIPPLQTKSIRLGMEERIRVSNNPLPMIATCTKQAVSIRSESSPFTNRVVQLEIAVPRLWDRE